MTQAVKTQEGIASVIETIINNYTMSMLTLLA